MAFAAAASLTLDVLTYNARLWGQTVFVQDRATAVYCDDHRRASLMQDRFRELIRPEPLPDVVGLTEFWDESLLSTFLESGLWGRHELACGPFGKGFSEIFSVMREKSPPLYFMISRYPDVIVKYFARSQLLEGASAVSQPASRFLNSIDLHVLEPIKGTLVKMMKGQSFLGSGLVLFSRHKILESSFVPFESEKFGLDNYARKGVLRAAIRLPSGACVEVFLTHLHVGKSESERSARRDQIRQLGPLLRSSPYPVILLSDLNILAEETDASGKLATTDEYRWAMDQLGLQDTFRDIYPNANHDPASGGYTYDDATHFSKALGIDAVPGSRRHLQRLDFILRNHRLKTIGCEVLRSPMTHPQYDNRDLSDHFPLRSILAVDNS